MALECQRSASQKTGKNIHLNMPCAGYVTDEGTEKISQALIENREMVQYTARISKWLQ